MYSQFFVLASLLSAQVFAYPQSGADISVSDSSRKPYVAPGPHDSRAPCPALNTLANHGYISHDGRNLKRQDLINAFRDHLGIDESSIDLALTNAFVVCEYVTGKSCGTTLKNLTLLAEPHAFEHDHSFSRQDYKMKYQSSFKEFSDNQNFNSSIFETSLDAVEGSTWMTIPQMNEVRLRRESLSYQEDYPGWFTESKTIQEFEAGFIFALVSDRSLASYPKDPMVRIDWWHYWFTTESLPYHLGWTPPSPPKKVDFVLSVSKAILAAHVTSTPRHLPTGAIGPAPAPDTLYLAGNPTTYAVPTFPPYAYPKNYVIGGRAALATPVATVSPALVDIEQLEAAELAAGPQIVFKNPYQDLLNVQDIANQQANAEIRMTKVLEALSATPVSA